MKGQILGFDGTTGAITGEDGQRYSFTLADWKGERPPQPRDSVDFVGAGGIATEVYHVASPLGAALSGAGAKFDLATIAAKPQVVLAALAILVALIFPYMSALGGGATLLSVATSGGNMMSASGGIGLLGLLAYLFLLVPIGAGAAIYFDLTGKRDKRIELVVGGLCVFAVIYFFLFRGAIASYPMGSYAAALISLDLGGYLIGLIGVGLIMTGLGKFNRIPGM